MHAISEDKIELLNRSFIRIFALPVTRLTIFQVQNTLKEIFPSNDEIINAVYQALLSGEIKEPLVDDDANEFSNFIEENSPYVRTAKEVAEAGEFLNIFNCEFLQQGNQVFFVNRMRRLDGQEFTFQSAPETNIRLAHMFVNRLQDLKKAVGGGSLNDSLKKELATIIDDIKSLL